MEKRFAQSPKLNEFLYEYQKLYQAWALIWKKSDLFDFFPAKIETVDENT